MGKQFLGQTKTKLKSDNSPVTQADFAVQNKIISEIIEQFPQHGIIAEEADSRKDCLPARIPELVWVIDPIDGTRNFARSVPIFCCSIALLRKGVPIVGVIYEPNFDWLFTATVGQVSKLNGKPISVSKSEFSITTVLAYSVDTCKPIPVKLRELFNECVFRNFGSAALHLAMTSAGMLDGVINFSGKLWDISAGALIAEQAGGIIRPVDDSSKEIWPIETTKYQNEAIPLCAGNTQIVEFIRGYK